jgi:hypothetical protein
MPDWSSSSSGQRALQGSRNAARPVKCTDGRSCYDVHVANLLLATSQDSCQQSEQACKAIPCLTRSLTLRQAPAHKQQHNGQLVTSCLTQHDARTKSRTL